MSTKTTFKRVALVAVAALGLGVLSVTPSQATIAADSLTLSATTAAITTADTSTAVTATLSFAGTTDIDSISVQADFVSGPAVFKPYLVLAETSSVTIDGVAAPAPGRVVYPSETTTVLSKSSSAFVSAKWNIVLASASDITKAATTAGTYVIKLTPKAQGSGVLVGSTAQTLTITVTTSPALDPVAKSATVYLNEGETLSATADATVTAVKTATDGTSAANAKAAATITVALKNAAGSATTAESYTATVSGPGILGSATFPASASPAENGAVPAGRAITVKAGNIVALFPDGSSGVSTVTISSSAGVILATKTVTFYGDAATITATAVKTVIGVGTTSAILVKLADAAATNVSNPTVFYVSSSDVTKISGAYTATSSITYSSTNTVDGVALGAGYLIPITGVAAGSANITVGTKSSATATTGVNATAVAVRVGSTTPASVSVTLDKASYAPGEKATLTVVLKDATGLELADGTYTSIFATGGIVADYAMGSLSDTTSATSVIGFSSLKKTYTLYMPVTEQDVTFSWTTGAVTSAANAGLAVANQGVAGKLVATVSSASSSAAIDAANEATDAANAATDAALAAADAADAATAAAEDASAAVATLAKSVNTALNNLKKQITALTALVNKLLKR
jgi:hypothetical protein